MLIKRRIDKYVLHDAMQGAVIADQLRRQLDREYVDAGDAKGVLALYRASCPTGGQDDLIIEELKEICRDLRWSKTKRGALISMFNDLIPGIYDEIRVRMGLPDIVIGAHAERLAVVVAGSVSTVQGRDSVLGFLKGKFPYPIIDKMTVVSAGT
jgi:hypothetical protein